MVIPDRGRISEVSPVIVIAYCLESLSWLQQSKGEPKTILEILLNRREKYKSSWNPRRLEIARNNTRDQDLYRERERASEICRSSPWVFEFRSVYAWQKTTLGQWKDHQKASSRLNNYQSSHRAGNSSCFRQPGWKDLQYLGYQVESSKRYCLSSRPKLSLV